MRYRHAVADGDSAIDPGAPVHILVSQDPLLVDRTVTRLRDAAVPEAARAFNYDVFDGKGLTAERILAAAQTMPMMARRRMVLVRDLTAMPAAELNALVPYLGDPNPSTVLVCVCGKADKRIKLFAAAAAARALHELAAPRNLTAWIRQEAGERRIALEPAAARRLADVVGKDLARLALCIEQLALYAGDRPVTADDVDELIAETRERTVFELIDAIGAGDRRKALEAVAALFEHRQSAIGMVVMLARHVRQLATVRAGLARSASKGELARAAGVPPFIVDKLAVQARRFSEQSLDAALARAAEADVALKGFVPGTRILGRNLADRVIVERLVTSLLYSR